jgi:DHA3 family macrolide efflux protein-like MFS transporter
MTREAQRTTQEPDRKMPTFLAVWLGQLLSVTGSAMTAFALGVYVFQQTGSSAQYALIVLMLYVPQILLTLAGGVLADRYSRRRLLLMANIAASVVSVGLVLVLAAHALSVGLVYAATFVFAICSAIQYPAFAASIALLVPTRHLSRANGLVQMAGAVSRVLAPVLAAALLVWLGILAVVIIDLATFLYAIATLAVVRIPQPARARPPAAGGWQVLREARAGLAFITERPGLLRLLGFFTAANVASGFALALLTPLVLRFGSRVDLGFVLSAEGAGLLLGAILMIVWGGPSRRIHGVLGAGGLFGLGIVALGAHAAVAVVAAAAFCYAMCLPVVNASNSTIWQSKVPAEMQGRVLGTLRTVALSFIPVSALLAGTLADGVFEPLMRAQGQLAGSVGRLIGVGPGRGIALMLVVVGLLPVVAAVAGYTSRPVRRVEADLPDAVVA